MADWITLDRWRGTRGIMGWITLKWDVYQLKRFVAKMEALRSKEKTG